MRSFLMRLRGLLFGGEFLRRATPFVILGAALGIAALLIVSNRPPESAPVAERVWHVAAMNVQETTARPQLRVFGEIVAGRSVDVRSAVAGEIVEVWPSFREGGIVRSGESLLRIDPFTYERAAEEARASLDEARARLMESKARAAQGNALLARDGEQLTLRRRDLGRAEELARQGHISQKTLDDKSLAAIRQEQTVEKGRSVLEIDQARLEQQRAGVARMESALKRARRNLEDTRLSAPGSGYLSAVKVGVGQRVGVNERLARLIEAGSLEVRFTLSDSQYGRLLADGGSLQGRAVRIAWRVGSGTLFFDAEIARTGALISAAAGGVNVFAVLSETALETPLRPGAFVEVNLTDRAYERVFRLPEEAVFDDQRVYAVRGGRLEARRVEVAGRTGGDLFVRGEISDGERILITRFTEAGPGVRVEILEERPALSAGPGASPEAGAFAKEDPAL